MDLWLLFVGCLLLLTTYKCSNNIYILVHRILGKQIIAVRRIKNDETWRSVLVKDKDWKDKLKAYRYPSTQIGDMFLNVDGTGDYCGAIEWKKI